MFKPTKKNSKSGQNTIEYILIFAICVASAVILLAPKKTDNSGVTKMGMMTGAIDISVCKSMESVGRLVSDVCFDPNGCSGECGNKVCEVGETDVSCPSDCVCAYCGDNACNGGENCSSCEADCGQCCGNGACDFGETCNDCPGDCGICCGNGLCEPGYGETCSNCTGDCGPCPIDGGWCGWSACSAACGPGTQTRTCQCPPAQFGGQACQPDPDGATRSCNIANCCGNNFCGDPGESCSTCPQDCGTCCTCQYEFPTCSVGPCGPLERGEICNCSPGGCIPVANQCIDGTYLCTDDSGCCDVWVPEQCGVNASPPCPDGQIRETRQCGQGTTQTQCRSDNSCIFLCLGSLPSSTAGGLCGGDGTGLPSNLPYVFTDQCTGRKCEVLCNHGNFYYAQ